MSTWMIDPNEDMSTRRAGESWWVTGWRISSPGCTASWLVWGDCVRELVVEAGLLISVLVTPFVFICCDSCFCESRDPTDSPAIAIGECEVMCL